MVVDAGLAEVVDAGAAVAEATVGVAVVDARGRPGEARRIARVKLTTAMVGKGISQSKGRFQKCFKGNKPELPSPQGTLKVTFAIASAGQGVERGDRSRGHPVSQCLETQVKGMVFPPHTSTWRSRVPFASTRTLR